MCCDIIVSYSVLDYIHTFDSNRETATQVVVLQGKGKKCTGKRLGNASISCGARTVKMLQVEREDNSFLAAYQKIKTTQKNSVICM